MTGHPILRTLAAQAAAARRAGDPLSAELDARFRMLVRPPHPARN